MQAVYEGLDRDVALEIAEQSHKDFKRVPGDGWYYGELSFEGAAGELLRHFDSKEGEVFVEDGVSGGASATVQRVPAGPCTSYFCSSTLSRLSPFVPESTERIPLHNSNMISESS